MTRQGLAAFLAVHRRFTILLSLCIAFSAVACVYFVRWLARPNTGLVVNYPEVVVENDQVIFSPSAPSSPAVASGLLPNRDALLSIDGRPVANSRDVLMAVSRMRSFDPFPVEVLRDYSERLTLSITPQFTPTRVDWLFVLVFCLALAYMAFTLTLRQPDQPYSVPLVLASLFYLVFTCVKPFYYESILSNSLIHLGKITSWMLVIFGLYFPSRRGSKPLRAACICAIIVLYAGFFVVRMGLYTRWMAQGDEALLERYRFWGIIGNISDAVAYVVWAALLAFAYFRTSLQRDKKQIQWMLAGLLIALPPYFFFDQLPLIMGRSAVRVSLGSFAELFLAFIPLFILVGLTRHRVFNLRFFLTRYILYAVLFIAMIGMFAALYLPLREYLAAGYRLPSPIAELAATCILFLALALLRALAVRLLESRFVGIIGSPSAKPPAELERRNAELMLIVEQMERRDTRLTQSRSLAELRAMLRGIVRRLQEPVNRMSAGLAGRDTPAAMEASILAADFLRDLDSLAGSSSAIPGLAVPEVLVRAAAERVRAKFPEVRLAEALEPGGRLSCYPDEIVKALCYILENSAESVQGRGGTVVVSVRSGDSRIVVEISDDGAGFDEGARRRLFTPFFTTKQGHQGLGLFFARMMIERNEGTLEVEKGEERGARIRLTFPQGEGR